MKPLAMFDAVIVTCVVLVASIGSLFTDPRGAWYQSLVLPSWAPGGAVIGAVWTTIFVLSAASAILAWRGLKPGNRKREVYTVFVVNGFLNVCWSLIFFQLHAIGAAAVEASILAATVVYLILVLWKPVRVAALLLIPYAVWTIFATYLTWQIFVLNP